MCGLAHEAPPVHHFRVSQFRTTLWSHLHAAGAGEQDALDEFVRRYRPPLLAFLRRRGLRADETEDVAQDVFLRLLNKDLLLKADSSKGRFRSYLLGITLRVLADQRRREGAEKRGGGWERVPLEAAPPQAVEAEFESCWLQDLMRRALAAVEASSPAHHELLGLASEGLSPAQIAERTNRSAGAIRVALHRARKRLAAELKNEVARYCSSEEEFETEMKSFARFLGPEG